MKFFASCIALVCVFTYAHSGDVPGPQCCRGNDLPAVACKTCEHCHYCGKKGRWGKRPENSATCRACAVQPQTTPSKS